jgi:hypothetical protein
MTCQNISAKSRQRLFDHRFDIAIFCSIPNWGLLKLPVRSGTVPDFLPAECFTGTFPCAIDLDAIPAYVNLDDRSEVKFHTGEFFTQDPQAFSALRIDGPR